MKRFQYTLLGIALSVIAVAVWMISFAPHGGVELSSYLFPLSSLMLESLYPQQSIPVSIWYASALMHWTVIGLIIDTIRFLGAN